MSSVDDAGAVRDFVNLVGRAGLRLRKCDVEHGADARGRTALDQHLLEMRHEIVRHRDVDRGEQFDPLHRPEFRRLDLDRLVEMRLEGLAHEAVEPHGAGVEVAVERRLEPRQDAAAALGGDAHDGANLGCELLHQRGVELDRQPCAVAVFVGEMIDAGVDVVAPAVRVGTVLVVDVIHSCQRLYSGASSSCSKPEPRSTNVHSNQFGSVATNRTSLSGSVLKCCTMMPFARSGRLSTSPSSQ